VEKHHFGSFFPDYAIIQLGTIFMSAIIGCWIQSSHISAECPTYILIRCLRVSPISPPHHFFPQNALFIWNDWNCWKTDSYLKFLWFVSCLVNMLQKKALP